MATLAIVAASYTACVSIATYPVVLGFGSELPGQLTDPLEHLWIIRWSKACLIEGRSPFFCPSLNSPTGVPFGYFPTMHIQTIASIALGLITDNDVAIFNTLWFSGFVATGLGTFVLAWWTVRKVWPSWLAGLGVMLCGPMLMHAHGHLETMQMGAVPLFLIGWLRFVDRPDWSRLWSALGLYLLVVACAPYFAVLAVFPAAWYCVWSMVRADGRTRRVWVVERSGWLLVFCVLALPGLAILFSSQLWAAGHGYSMMRTRAQFDQFGAPGWSTFFPSPLHALGRFATPDIFAATGYASRMSECSSYLGVVTLAMLVHAAARRLRFANAGYWWSVLALMIVLSWGSRLDLGWARIGLPAGWIYGIFPPFHLIRVPARFNLFAAVCAAVPASAAFSEILGRVGRSGLRATFAMSIAGMMVVDLSMVPFETAAIPPMPAIYRTLANGQPEVNLVDAPMFGSNEGQVFSSLWGYWQSIHLARTTAGYPGLPNVPFESEIVRASPFWAGRLLDPRYLARDGLERFGAADGVAPRDYVWLFLTVHRFDHVVLHQGIWTNPKYAMGNARLKTLLSGAKSFEDLDVAVFDRSRIQAPDRLTWLCAEGFRPGFGGSYGVLRRSKVAVFNPSPERPMILSLVDASAFERTRVVRLMGSGREIARWTIEPGRPRTFETPPFHVGGEVEPLSLEADGDDRPARFADRLDDARTPFSLRIRSVRCRPVDGPDR